jgi:hypothetical protein
MNRIGKVVLSTVAFALILELFLLMDLPFFWDGISKAYRANWIYTNGFSSLIVPTEFNSGHPPLWITLIALFWTLFGKTVWAARLLLLLVNLGVFYQLFLLCKKSFVPGVSLFFFFLVAIDPTLIAQTTILNNDMLLLFFILLGLNSLLTHRWGWYTLAITGLLLTNLRGIYCVISLGAIHLLWVRYTELAYDKKMVRAYIAGSVIFIGFLFVQYGELGWILISKNENYAAHRETAGLVRVAKNAVAYVKNLLDFGRVFLWIPLAILLVIVFKNKNRQLTQSSKRIFIALTVFILLFFFGFVPFSNPMGPRYLMICFILASILFVNLLFSSQLKGSRRKGLVAVIALAFITGHFWIYPATISQGWDSSLAYLNYFSEEQKMLTYISEENIPYNEIGTHLPLNSKHMATVGATEKFSPRFANPDLETNKYFLFSNVENRTKDEGIRILRSEWKEMVTYSRMGVFLTLYENPKKID